MAAIFDAILDFGTLEWEEKMTPYFFSCLCHILKESGEFLLLPKKIQEITNEPRL